MGLGLCEQSWKRWWPAILKSLLYHTLLLPDVLLGSGRGSMSRADFTSTVLGLAGGAKELDYGCESSQTNSVTVNSQHWPPRDSTVLVSASH